MKGTSHIFAFVFLMCVRVQENSCGHEQKKITYNCNTYIHHPKVSGDQFCFFFLLGEQLHLKITSSSDYK